MLVQLKKQQPLQTFFLGIFYLACDIFFGAFFFTVWSFVGMIVYNITKFNHFTTPFMYVCFGFIPFLLFYLNRSFHHHFFKKYQVTPLYLFAWPILSTTGLFLLYIYIVNFPNVTF